MRLIRLLLVVLVLLATSSIALADISRFAGNWENVDPKTRGLSKLNIDIKGTRVRIQAFGKCHPRDCPWGFAAGTVYAPSVESSMVESAQAISTIYITSFSQVILIIRPVENDQIEVEKLTKFTDESGRANTRYVERMKRVEAVGLKR